MELSGVISVDYKICGILGPFFFPSRASVFATFCVKKHDSGNRTRKRVYVLFQESCFSTQNVAKTEAREGKKRSPQIMAFGGQKLWP